MRKNSILIVDDNPHIRKIYSDILFLYGYQTMVATDGVDALKKLESSMSLPDLILLDLEMPLMNGEEFRIRQLASERLKDIQVIVSSASIDLEQKCLVMGIKNFVLKPVSIDVLIKKVQSLTLEEC